MNDELQKALTTILAKTTSAAEAGVAFLSRELPEVIQQLLVWNAVISAIYFILFIAAAVVMFFLGKKAWAWAIDEGSGAEPFAAIPFGLCFMFIMIALRSLEWLQILLAPKVYLIEYAARLAK